MSSDNNDGILLLPLRLLDSFGLAITRLLNSFASDRRKILLERIHHISLEISDCNEQLIEAISSEECSDSQRSKIVQISSGGLELNTKISTIFNKVQDNSLDPADYDEADLVLDSAKDWCDKIHKLFN